MLLLFLVCFVFVFLFFQLLTKHPIYRVFWALIFVQSLDLLVASLAFKLSLLLLFFFACRFHVCFDFFRISSQFTARTVDASLIMLWLRVVSISISTNRRQSKHWWLVEFVPLIELHRRTIDHYLPIARFRPSWPMVRLFQRQSSETRISLIYFSHSEWIRK